MALSSVQAGSVAKSPQNAKTRRFGSAFDAQKLAKIALEVNQLPPSP